jgi:excisionase family DNA binding protein
MIHQGENHMDKRSYTVLEIADLLQISRNKAYDLCKQGCFRTIKVGRSIRISKASFDQWLDSLDSQAINLIQTVLKP